MPKEILGRKMYPIEEVAEMLGVQTRTVRGYIRQGRLKGAKFNKRWHISEDELSNFITGTGERKTIKPNDTLQAMLEQDPQALQAFEGMPDRMRRVLNAWAEMDDTQRAWLENELEPKTD